MKTRRLSGEPVSTPSTRRKTCLTVVIPTRDEAGNVHRLLQRLSTSLAESESEVIFVDDSDDATVETVERHRPASMTVRVIHRPRGERTHGLGGAVLEGFHAAGGDWICVMDGDLQHPPEIIPCLLTKAAEDGSDLVVASRFHPEATRQARSRRNLASWGATAAARALFRQRLRATTDPLSGFFLIRRDKLDPERLHPRGFKILLDILVRVPDLRVSEIGFEFGVRSAGRSKLSVREALRYVTHLAVMRTRPSRHRAASILARWR